MLTRLLTAIPIAVAGIALSALTPALGQEFESFVGQVVVENANVRAGQSENFETLCRLKQGDFVVVVDKSYSWYKIRLPKRAESYVHSEYVRMLDRETGRIIGTRVNVRGGPGTIYTVLGQARVGDEVKVLDEQEEWLRITPIDDSYGWISEELIAFHSKDVDAFAVLEANRSERAAVPVSLPEETPEESGPVTVEGYLKPHGLATSINVSYKLMVNDFPAYYIQGPREVLESFVDQKVKIEGEITEDVKTDLSSPIIKLSRIQLVL